MCLDLCAHTCECVCVCVVFGCVCEAQTRVLVGLRPSRFLNLAQKCEKVNMDVGPLPHH